MKNMEFGELILIVLGKLFGHVCDSAEDKFINNILRDTSDPNNWWYTDRYGRRIDKRTGHVVTCSHINNETIEVDCITGEVLINYTKLNREKKDNEKRLAAIKEGKTVYNPYYRPEEYRYINKPIYKDINNGDMYVSTFIGKASFYIRIKDGEIIRKTDNQIELDKKYNINYWPNEREMNRFLLKIRYLKDNPNAINYL